MRAHFPADVKAEVIRKKTEGISAAELSKEYNVSKKTIYLWLRGNENVVGSSSLRNRKSTAAGLYVQRKGRFTDEFRKEIVARYQNGKSIPDLCEEIKIGRSTLYRWISLYTLFRRNAGELFTSIDVYRLREENRMLYEENQVLRHCKCHPSDSLNIKMQEMKKWQDQFSIHALCRAMDVKRGTFYNYLFRSKPQTLYSKTDEMLRPLIQTVFDESKERFGANKIRIKLAEQGIKVSAAHIKRLMKEMNLLAKQARLRCYNSTNRQYIYRRNRDHQDFTRTAPNQLWVSDVTYARVNADFYAICVIIDIFSRKVLAHKISRQNNTTLVLAAFQDAFEKRGNPQNLMFHSDQGLQYTAYRFRKYLRDHNVKQSFSNPGTPYDNAVAESFFSIMKREELSHNYYHSEEELSATVAEYIDFFNRQRPHHKMGDLTPDEIEKRYYMMAKTPDSTPTLK